MAKVFSGIQPTGSLTIGHYIGTIKNWLELQGQHDCFFCIVDMHAITVPQKPEDLRSNIRSAIALFLACGLDEKSVFVQSSVSAHVELAWLLQCNSPLGQLQRMTQFKDKSSNEHEVCVGLLTYPVLMASDILLYDTDLVPVGHDQKQHLELTRDLALKFNHKYGQIFKVPEPVIADNGARIMSLQDPYKKMSKSDPNQGAWVSLIDSPEVILKKLKKSVTDSLSKVSFDQERPGISNLVAIYSAITGKSYMQIEHDYNNLGYGIFKQDLADILITELLPIQESYKVIIKDESLLAKVIENGAARAKVSANQTLDRVKNAIGL